MGLQIFRHMKEKDDGHYNIDVLLRDFKIPILRKIYPRLIMSEIFVDTEARPQGFFKEYIQEPFLKKEEMDIK